MSDFYLVVLIPILITIFCLIIEYWIIQPIRERISRKEQIDEKKSFKNESPLHFIFRLIRSFPHVNLYKVSASFINIVGSFIASLPRAIVVSTISVLSILVAMPLFLDLYNTEKYGICRYKPTCKEYLLKSIESYGPVRGTLLGMMRVARCNKYAKGGKDSVPKPKKLEKVAFSYRKQGRNFRRQYNLILISLFLLPFMCASYLALVGYIAYNLIEIQNLIGLLVTSILIAIFSWSIDVTPEKWT